RPFQRARGRRLLASKTSHDPRLADAARLALPKADSKGDALPQSRSRRMVGPLARRASAEVARPLRCAGHAAAALEMQSCRTARRRTVIAATKARPRKPKGVSMSTVRVV